MRAALLLPGQVRTYTNCIGSLKKNIIEPLERSGYSVDIFAVTTTNGSSSVLGQETAIYDAATLKQARAAYNPVCFVVQEDHPDLMQEEERLIDLAVQRQQSPAPGAIHYFKESVRQFYKLYHCNRLRKEHELAKQIQYDVVIRSRFDLFHTVPIDIHHLVTCHTGRYIFINHGSIQGLYDGSDSINDHFAFGSADVMDIYCDLILDYGRYRQSELKREPIDPQGRMYYLAKTNHAYINCPEYQLGLHLLHNNVPINSVRTGAMTDAVRRKYRPDLI